MRESGSSLRSELLHVEVTVRNLHAPITAPGFFDSLKDHNNGTSGSVLDLIGGHPFDGL